VRGPLQREVRRYASTQIKPNRVASDPTARAIALPRRVYFDATNAQSRAASSAATFASSGGTLAASRSAAT